MEGPPEKRFKVDETSLIRKRNALMFVIYMHEIVHVIGDLPGSDFCIDYWTQISSINFTALSIMKQRRTKVGGMQSMYDKEVTLYTKKDEENTTDGLEYVVLKYKKVVDVMEKCFKILFPEDTEANNNLGTITSILGSIAAFSKRVDEVRNQPTGLANQKDTPRTPFSEFGLHSGYANLAEGSSYEPKLRASVMKSIGPATILMMIKKGGTENFMKKLKSAYKFIFGLIDPDAGLFNAVKNGDTEVIQLLSDLAYFGVTRSQNKAYIPYIILRNALDLQVFQATEAKPFDVLKTLLSKNKLFSNMDFSGKGFWAVYKTGTSKKITAAVVDGTAESLSQVFAHGVLGSHKEDLSVLDAISNTMWKRRSEIGKCMDKRMTDGKIVEIKFPVFNLVCKFASAAQTDLAPGNKGVDTRFPVLSGKIRVSIDDDSSLRKKLVQNCVENYQAVSSTMSTANHLRRFYNYVNDKIRGKVYLEFGTVSFYKGVSDDGSKYGEEHKEPIVARGRFWFQHVV